MPWYKSGTVSVAQNSNAVIGTGTAFIANSRVGDAFRGPDGGWYEVTNIASDTALSISPNYQGVTNAAGVYALAPMQGYVKDSADALRALVNTYGVKLAALGTTGNYEILPVEKGGTGRAGPALGTAAAATVTTSTTDTTLGHLLKVGDLGLGLRIDISGTDLNALLTPGQYWHNASPGVTNCPVGAAAGYVDVSIGPLAGSTRYEQNWRQLGPNVLYRRTWNGVAWLAWDVVAMGGANSSITSMTGLTTPLSVAQGGTGKTSMGAASVGVVSQSGGVPTGAVVETGSNTNGKYTKFASGLLICEGAVADFLMAANSITACPTVTFPSAFIDTSYVVITDGTPAGSYDTYGYISPNAKAATFFNKMYRNGATAQWIVLGRYVAIGRWF
ncbi:pyocin knob domain-containing protein [Pseudomonas sp. LB3P58]